MSARVPVFGARAPWNKRARGRRDEAIGTAAAVECELWASRDALERSYPPVLVRAEARASGD